MRDRRGHVRHRANLVVSVSTEERKDRVAVSSDVSAGGMVFHSLSRFSVGEVVNLIFEVGPDERTAVGRVVRAGRDPRWHLFPNVTAVAFDRPRPEIVPSG